MGLDEIINQLPFSMNGYEFKTLIRRGSISCTVKTIHTASGNVFAAKIFDLKESKVDSTILADDLRCFTNFYHINVIKIYDKFVEKDLLFMMLEFCSNGSISDAMYNGVSIAYSQTLSIMKQLLSAIEYCHKQGFAHRNIKTSNVLINNSGLIKMSDFELGTRNLNFDNSNSYEFKAPEVIRNEKHCPFKADIWSLGVTFFNIVTRCSPWGFTKEEIKNNMKNGIFKFPINTPQPIIDIVNHMIVVNPEDRSTASELLKNPCFSTINATNERLFVSDESKSIPICTKTRKSSFNASNGCSVFSRSVFPSLVRRRSNSRLQRNEKQNFDISPLVV